MKSFILSFLFVLTLSVSGKSYGQSGWQESRYYSEQGTSDIICGNPYSVIIGYDYYGRAIYKWYQNCQQRNWYSWYGKRGGYFWICNGYNCFWDIRQEERTWWYFTWYNFTREY